MKVRLAVVMLFCIAGAHAAILPSAVAGQTSEATISGAVTDATGGALPGVTVTAIHRQTGQRHSATTNAEGFYAIRPLPIGPYLVEADRETAGGGVLRSVREPAATDPTRA